MRYSYIYDKSAPLSILITEDLYKDIIKSLSQNYIISGNIPYSVRDTPFFLYNKSTLFISLLLVIFLFFIGTINKKANN